MKLSLIFPAYNEAESITSVLEGFSRYFLARQIDYEIIVVDDGSHDATSAKVQRLVDSNHSIQLINHSTNLGYGAALRSGFSAATGDFFFYTDSDGQFAPGDLDQTLPLIGLSTIILGYRQPRVEGILRRLSAWLWGQWVGLSLGIRVRDLNCAWKLFPRSLLDDVRLVSNGAFISAELLYSAKRKQFTFREIPVKHFPRKAGSSTGTNPQVIWRAFRELANFLRHRRFV